MALRYGSVCSGIEAASVAWHPLGWHPQFFSEIEAAPRAVLKHHWPEVPLHGDFTTIREGEYGAIDLLVGGTPCQSFSVAGLRGGLADGRGNLALEYLRLAQRLCPRWLVWENVPGVLSSNGGRDFGAILGGMVELGYGFAYRVLDAQYVRVDGYGRAVPQRRRRVFVVGHSRDWRRAAAVLFERACLRGDPAPRREAGQDTARCLTRGSGGGQRCDWETETFVGCLNGHSEYGADIPTLRAKGGDAAGGSEALIAFDARQSEVCIYGDRAGALDTDGHSQAICFDEAQITSAANRTRVAPGLPSSTLSKQSRMHVAFSCKDSGADATSEGVTPTLRAMGFDQSHANAGGQLAVAHPLAFQVSESGVRAGDVHATLDANNGPRRHNGVFFGGPAHWAVRRLTPRECERLQGFPDDYTLIPWRNGLMADGPRYKALGNSMAVNVMRWIGRRIEMVEALGVQIGRAA